MKKTSLSLRIPNGLRMTSRRQLYGDAVFMSIGDGAIVTNEEGKITKINDTALRILGHRKADVMGQWFQKVMHAKDEMGNDIDLMDRPITRAILSGEPITARMRYETKDGRQIPVLVTVSPIIFNGKPYGAVEVFRDISAEEEVERLKSEFISLASHQLRTPLTAISTYTHLLVNGFRGDITDGQREFLQTILASTERMNTLIDTLLNVSRLESGTISVRVTPVDTTTLVRTIQDELWPLIEPKHLNITFNHPDQNTTIHTDKLLLGEVITNILSNAIKYTPAKGTITIDLSLQKTTVTLTVSDTGYGIPEELQARVFSKFFRAPNILHEEAVGTGLGLYLVHQIVTRNLQGSISFTSTENVGTTFTIVLPRKLIDHRAEVLHYTGNAKAKK